MTLSSKKQSTNELNRVIFTASDIDHLATRFTIQELRHELHKAEDYKSIALFLCLDDELNYYKDYAEAVKLAIELREWSQQTSATQKPTPGTPRVKGEEVKNRIDIVNIIEQYTQLRKSGRNFLGCCPIHDDRHPSMMVYPEEQRWWCYGCNRGGDAIEFIMAIEKMDFKDALATLAAM